MSVSVKTLIGQLPPYRDEWITIHPNQTVKDIMQEVCEAHEEFAPYYDKIALYFAAESTEKICENISDFLKKNLHYTEETETHQTSALPTGILIRGSDKSIGIDCKHYSGMSAGIIDALNRQGAGIDWNYRFASYKILDSTPHHVFVVVRDEGTEIWIDPTPGSELADPVWQVDKKIEAMALKRNIGGFETEYLVENNGQWEADAIGRRPKWQLMPMEGARGNPSAQGPGPNNKYFTGPFLGLEFYSEDPLSIEGTNWNTTADAVNAAIQKGPSPGHSFPADYIKWIYDANVKGWNFYYPNGAAPDYVPALPASYPQMMISDDGRLTFDKDVKIDDYHNEEIHALTAWAQSIINKEDPTPYPVKPQHLKEFSQLKYGNAAARDLFTERRGTAFTKEVTKAVGTYVKFVAKGVAKIVGSVPRNAFLALVGLNMFGFATKMAANIEEGNWDKMSKKWKALGGNPEKLLGTIEDGKKKKEVLGAAIGEAVTATAIIAAAAPIVAAMLAFIKDPDGKIKNVLQATKAAMAVAFPNIDLTPFGFLDKDTGKEIEWQVDEEDDENKGGGNNDMPSGGGDIIKQITNTIKKNPMMAAAGVGGLVYLLTNKSGSKPNFIFPIIAAAAAWFFLSKGQGSGGGTLTVEQKRAALIAWAGGDTAKNKLAGILQNMTDTEINYTYEFIFLFNLKGIQVPKGSNLYNAIKAIGEKYNIFT